MTTLTDTPAQRVTRSASHRYAARVNTTPDSRHIRDAIAAADEIDQLQQQLAEARARRDRSIALAAREDALRVPDIARALGERDGVSVSNIRHILKFAAVRGTDQ